MFFCEDFLEMIKHDFATEPLSSNWNVWFEIEKYCMIFKIKKTDEAFDFADDRNAFEDDECVLVQKIIDYHQKNSFGKLREVGWCSENNPGGCFGYFEFTWYSPCESFEPEIKKCNCKHCFLRFSEQKEKNALLH